MSNQIFQGSGFSSYINSNGLIIDFTNSSHLSNVNNDVFNFMHQSQNLINYPIFYDDEPEFSDNESDFTNEDVLNRLLEQTFTNNDYVPQHLTENKVKSLKKTKFSNIMNINLDNKICSICLDEFEEEQNVIILSCKHIFHSNCIEEWLLKYGKTCPTCRKKID